jgi:putative lipoprotein
MLRRPDPAAILAMLLALSACRAPEADRPSASPATDLLPVVAVAAKPDSEWVRFLPELLPAIRTCLTRAPETDPFVPKAWPMNHGRLMVRVATRDGRRYDCMVQDFTDSVTVETFEEVAPDAEPVPGERNPIFLLPDAPLLDGECWLWEKAEDPGGRVLGILGYSTC